MTARRVKSSWVADETGLSMRQVQQMAIEGKIPSAAKLGGVWTFNPQAVKAMIQSEEDKNQPCQKISTGGAPVRRGGPASRSRAETIDEAYERALR